MALMEYYRYDGVEIFNSLRVGAYAKNMGLGFFRCDDACPSLQKFLEDTGQKELGIPYTFPQAPDNRAPWWDGAVSASSEFAGAHLLDIGNIGSSTRTGVTSEYIGDGGWVQGSRRSSREMVFRALLIGSTLEGARYGLSWLSTVLEGGDVCRRVKRVRNTYSDISFGWNIYKRDELDVIPDNVYQANQAAGFATGPLPGDGNTYANLRDNSVPAFFPLDPSSTSIYAQRHGLGFSLDFLINCPDAPRYNRAMRHIEDCAVLSGPTILSEHVLGDDCESGAWVEVEFTLLGGNPGVWWNQQNVLATEASSMTYSDFLPCVPPSTDCHPAWTLYKGGDALPVDDDLFSAPLAVSRNQTYSGLLGALWDRISFQGGVGARALAETPSSRLSASPSASGVLVDPNCPTPLGYPGAPQDDAFCPPPYDGPVNRFRYEVDSPSLPRFLPTAVTTTIHATDEVRDVVVTFIPQLGQADASRFLSFRVTWIPADSLFVIDGVNRRADVLLNYTKPEGQQEWKRADHLIFRENGSYAYDYPEVVCGSRSIIYFDIPTQFDPFGPNFGLVTTSRDV